MRLLKVLAVHNTVPPYRVHMHVYYYTISEGDGNFHTVLMLYYAILATTIGTGLRWPCSAGLVPEIQTRLHWTSGFGLDSSGSGFGLRTRLQRASGCGLDCSRVWAPDFGWDCIGLQIWLQRTSIQCVVNFPAFFFNLWPYGLPYLRPLARNFLYCSSFRRRLSEIVALMRLGHCTGTRYS